MVPLPGGGYERDPGQNCGRSSPRDGRHGRLQVLVEDHPRCAKVWTQVIFQGGACLCHFDLTSWLKSVQSWGGYPVALGSFQPLDPKKSHLTANLGTLWRSDPFQILQHFIILLDLGPLLLIESAEKNGEKHPWLKADP